MKVRHTELLIHLGGILLFLSIPVLASHEPTLTLSPGISRDFMGYLLAVGYFYLNYFIFIPRLFFKRKYFLFVGSALIFFALITAIPPLFIHFPTGQLPPPPPPKQDFPVFFHINHNFLKFSIAVFLSSLLRISKQWRETEKEKLYTEIAWLKAQMNPHFLFNTLNTLYSLSLENAPESSTAILRLSDMMRYMTDESQQDFVSLEKEIEYLDNYVELQKLRFSATGGISWKKEGNSVEYRIAPLILITFIENAFKHGINGEAGVSVSIYIGVREGKLTLTVENKIVKAPASLAEERTGIGITNTQNRLKLIYPDAHELKMEQTDTSFKVFLTLQLL
ncbi:MAG: sensor histidine kinase [Bacteroidia bacterium]|nr:sensor histidine kinase [Bacteroidia bacterium]